MKFEGLRELALLLGPLLILVLAYNGYTTVQTFYRRFAEAWVTTINLESMLHIRYATQDIQLGYTPVYISTEESFIPTYYWSTIKQVFDQAKKEGWKAEQVAIEAIMEQGFTLTQMGRVEEAKELLEQAWKLRHLADPTVQVAIAENFAQLYIRANDFDKARPWLKRAEERLRALRLSTSEHPRHLPTINYYHGIIYMARGDLNRAAQYFKEAYDEARKIGWQRGMIYVQQFLADIARGQSDFEKAEALLWEGLSIAERNEDRRRTAYYKRSFAYLVLKRDRWKNVDEVMHWAQKALDDFNRLGIEPEANKLRHLLENLQLWRQSSNSEVTTIPDLVQDRPAIPTPTRACRDPLINLRYAEVLDSSYNCSASSSISSRCARRARHSCGIPDSP